MPRKELPELDVSLRGAVSIARRLQDPLAELVKIDPKSIGVGQYQHDVNQTQLSRALDAVVEDCVNAVGVDVNLASAKLLARVSGLNESAGPEHRRAPRPERPRSHSRQALLKVRAARPQGLRAVRRLPAHPRTATTRSTPRRCIRRAIRWCAASSPHLKSEIRAVIGDAGVLRSLKPEQFADDKFGVPTVTDILKELEKPGRDPRPEFKTASFKDGVEEMKDLAPGMLLEGVVTNVANFGAFVDIGVHQDGLVHVSALADRFVKDPREVVKPGDIVKVKVLEVDLKRKRIALTMRLRDEAGSRAAAPGKPAATDRCRSATASTWPTSLAPPRPPTMPWRRR